MHTQGDTQSAARWTLMAGRGQRGEQSAGEHLIVHSDVDTEKGFLVRPLEVIGELFHLRLQFGLNVVADIV